MTNALIPHKQPRHHTRSAPPSLCENPSSRTSPSKHPPRITRISRINRRTTFPIRAIRGPRLSAFCIPLALSAVQSFLVSVPLCSSFFHVPHPCDPCHPWFLPSIFPWRPWRSWRFNSRPHHPQIKPKLFIFLPFSPILTVALRPENYSFFII